MDLFEAAVESALQTIPPDLLAHLENVVVVAEDEPSCDDLESVGLGPEDSLFGLYQGVPLPLRETGGFGELPDRIVIYRRPLLEACADRRELMREIRDTVIHEVGHYFGFEEEDLP